MLTFSYDRERVSSGDDVGRGLCRIELPEDAVLGDLIEVILHGGKGNDLPIPYTGANSFWVIRSDSGALADVYTDKDGEWIVRYLTYPETTPLKTLGLTRVSAACGLDPKDRRASYNGYAAATMTGKEIRTFLADAYTLTGPYHAQTAGEKIEIRKFKKIQDGKAYLVFYNDSFFKIMDAQTLAEICFLTYTKEKPKRLTLPPLETIRSAAVKQYVAAHAFCPEFLFRDWNAFLDLLYREGGRISAISWWDHCRKNMQHESAGSGGYTDPVDPDYMYAETQVYEDGFETASLDAVKEHIAARRASGLILGDKYFSFDLVPSFELDEAGKDQTG